MEKRSVPNVIRINYERDPEAEEGLMLMHFSHALNEGYTLSPTDSQFLCAILIREAGTLEAAPRGVKDFCALSEATAEEIRFCIIYLAIQKNEDVSEEGLLFFYTKRRKIAIERKTIVRKEISRVINNANKITLKNSQYYRNLVDIVSKFSDITLIDWFIPIQLTFEKFVHIYVKHVEETKFGEREEQKRSFFDYAHTEILTLLKMILKQEEEDIKEHFVFCKAGAKTKDKKYWKDYRRGFGKHPKLLYDGREFVLAINKNGIIESFYQKKN